MFTRKEKRNMRNRISEINARFLEVADLLTTEKRSMTKEEADEKEALKMEKEVLELRLMQSEQRQISPSEVSNDRAFDVAIDAMVRNITPENESLASMLSYDGGKATLKVPVTRDIQDTASVDPLVPLTIGDIIEPLEKGLILHKLGIKFQHGMKGAWDFPIVAGVEASLEGETVEISDSTIDISKISPSPKRAALSIPISNRAINQSNGVIRQIVLKQIGMATARLLNKWMFNKEKITTLASEGCFVSPKTKLSDALNWASVVALECDVMATGVNMEDNTGAYVCNAKVYAKLKTTSKDAGSGQMLIDTNGKLNGYPVFVTEYITADTLGFGVFSYQLVGQFGDANLVYDPYTGAKKNLVYFVYNADFDMLSLRKEAFGILTIKATEAAGE